MYPTDTFPGYGSFVKNVCDELSKYGILIKYKSIIKGKTTSKYKKFIKYLCFYKSILINYGKKYDFIYVHFPNQATPILKLLLKFCHKKLIINFHGEDLLYSQSSFGNTLGKMTEQLCIKFADGIIVPSEYFKSLVIQRNLISDSNRIIVSPSGGINSSIFFPDPQKNYNRSEIHIGYVGRMEPDKGIIEFIDTCKKLGELNIYFKATAIGYGSVYNQVKKDIVDSGLSKKVTLISGLPQKELGDYYRKFDLFIFSSSRKAESLGLTGIEAMACGVPVIGGNVGGIASYVKNDINGWITPIHDVDAIVSTIKRYIDLSIDKKKELHDNCIKTGRYYYSDAVCKRLASDIRKIINEYKF